MTGAEEHHKKEEEEEKEKERVWASDAFLLPGFCLTGKKPPWQVGSV
jgi:hypothetical protein